MGLPAYYVNTSPPDEPTVLPISWDPLSNPYKTAREQIKLKTGLGVTFEYEMYNQVAPVFIFTIPRSLLPQFRAMYDAVVGDAFYFIPDNGVSPADVMYVRIKDPTGFEPEPLGVYLFEGNAEQLFKYELRLIGEIAAASIDD